MVKNILLIRHCEAALDAPTKRDFDRPLTQNGLNQAELLGQHIDGLSIDLQALYVSPAKRTMQTTAGIMKQLSQQARLMDAEEIYEATENVLKAVVLRFDPDFDHVAMVGHNPAISQLFAYLTEDARSFAPGTMAWLRFDVDDWNAIGRGSGSLVDFYTN